MKNQAYLLALLFILSIQPAWARDVIPPNPGEIDVLICFDVDTETFVSCQNSLNLPSEEIPTPHFKSSLTASFGSKVSEFTGEIELGPTGPSFLLNHLSSPNQSYPIYTNPLQPIPVQGGTAADEVAGAVAAWNATEAGFKLYYAGDIAASLANNPNFNVIQYIVGSCPYAFGCNAATILRLSGSTILSAGFEIYSLKNNGGTGTPITYTATLAAAGKQRLWGLMLHELGHFLGFLHPDPGTSHPLTVMDPCTNCNFTSVYPDDLSQAESEYGNWTEPMLLSNANPLGNELIDVHVNFTPASAGKTCIVILSFLGTGPIPSTPVGDPAGFFFTPYDSRQITSIPFLLPFEAYYLVFPGGYAMNLDANGQADLQFATPPGLTGILLQIQALVIDPSAVSGFLFSPIKFIKFS